MGLISWNFDAQFENTRKNALELCMKTAEVIKGKAVNRCPLDTGALRNSATVTKLKNGAEISFNTPYALIMHEKQGYAPSHPGTGPNYLRGPLLESEKEFLDDMKSIMRR